jgi:hypothetical protein
VITQEDAKKFMVRCQEDPLFFIREVLGGNPWGKQREIIESVRDNSRTTVRSCSGSGKSWTASCIALWFLYSFKPSTVLTTAPTGRQVKDILWREISSRYSGAKMPLAGELLQTSLQLNEKWFAFGISTKEPERFQGFHNEHVLVIVDEASGIDGEIFNAIENPLSTGHTRLLLIGNPTQLSGKFFDSFEGPEAQFFNKIHISAFDTPNFTGEGEYPFLVTKQWVDERRIKWTEDSPLWQIYVMGDFPKESLNTLIPVSWIEKARQQEIEPKGGVIFGVDIARFGDDESVVIARQGGKVIAIESWNGMDTTVTTERVTALAEQYYPIRINVDEIGVGAGVVDSLKKLNFPVTGVNVGGKARKPDAHLNIRAEMYWDLRTKFQNGEIQLIDDPVLIGQLSKLQYGFNERNQKLQMESKDEAKKKGKGSPDKADALALAFYGFRPSQTIEPPQPVNVMRSVSWQR